MSGMSQLQQLELSSCRGAANLNKLHPQLVQPILAISPQLTNLTLMESIGQTAFDALLAHGTRLTSLTCGSLKLRKDRSQAACSWKELTLQYQAHDLKLLSYLPLHSLTHLRFGTNKFQLPMPGPFFGYNPCSDEHPDTPALLRSALTNLAKCPAWQGCGPAVLIGVENSDYTEDVVDLQQITAMLQGLSLVSDKEVELFIQSPFFCMGSEAVRELDRVLGSRLTCLELHDCRLERDFLPAVWAHLPGLTHLLLSLSSSEVSAEDVASFCSHATHPLQLALHSYLYEEFKAGSRRFQEQCRIWKVPQVTVTEWKD
jgi:hypothetical protein